MGIRERVVVGVGTAIIIAALGARHGVPAMSSWTRTVRADAAALASEAARAHAAIGELALTLDSLEARRDRFVGSSPRFLGGTAPDAAASTLSAYVSGRVQMAGGRLISVSTSHDTLEASPLRTVQVRVNIEADVLILAALLAGLEAGPELVAIRAMEVTAADVTAAPSETETLVATLTVEALYLDRSEDADDSIR